jgi:diadenylate cyclase
MLFSPIDQIVRRFGPYPWYEVAVELLVIWVCMYLTLRFLHGTRGAGVVKGFAFLLIVLTLGIRVLGGWAEAFTRLNFIYDKFLGLLAVLLVVVFQPELRRAMVRLGETRLLRPARRNVVPVVEAVSEAVEFLSKSHFGALIAIERGTSLTSLAQSGVLLNARISGRLLMSIFWPNNPLHDLGVVVSGDRVLAAGVQFPLIDEDMVTADLGSRHRAGMGLSAESDCIVVIVSEETGRISIAESGRLERDIPRDALASVLLKRLRAPNVAPNHEPTAEEGLADASPPESRADNDADVTARRDHAAGEAA